MNGNSYTAGKAIKFPEWNRNIIQFIKIELQVVISSHGMLFVSCTLNVSAEQELVNSLLYLQSNSLACI